MYTSGESQLHLQEEMVECCLVSLISSVVQVGSVVVAVDCSASAAVCEQELTGISAAALVEAC